MLHLYDFFFLLSFVRQSVFICYGARARVCVRVHVRVRVRATFVFIWMAAVAETFGSRLSRTPSAMAGRS